MSNKEVRPSLALAIALVAVTGSMLTTACAPSKGGGSPVTTSPPPTPRAQLAKAVRDSFRADYDETAPQNAALAATFRGASLIVGERVQSVSEERRPQAPSANVAYPVTLRAILASGDQAITLNASGNAEHGRANNLIMAEGSPGQFSAQARCAASNCARIWIFLVRAGSPGTDGGAATQPAVVPVLFRLNEARRTYAIEWSAPADARGELFLTGGQRLSAEDAVAALAAAPAAPAAPPAAPATAPPADPAAAPPVAPAAPQVAPAAPAAAPAAPTAAPEQEEQLLGHGLPTTYAPAGPSTEHLARD